MNNISTQALATLYEEIEEAFSAALILGKHKKALGYAMMMLKMEQNDLVPHNVEEQEAVH